MIFKNIALPFDGSEQAKKALATACAFKQEDHDVIINVISVAHPDTGNYAFNMGMGYGPEEYRELREQKVEQQRVKVEREISEFVPEDIKGTLKVSVCCDEDPAEIIIDFYKRHNCDLIVMGSRGLGKFRGAFGSVSTQVLHEAQIPVLIVK